MNEDDNDMKIFGVRVIGFPTNELCIEAGYNKTIAGTSSGTDDNEFYTEASYRF